MMKPKQNAKSYIYMLSLVALLLTFILEMRKLSTSFFVGALRPRKNC